MSTTVFELTGLLGTGLTTASNPAPSSLTTTNPYPATPAHTHDVSTAWSAQAKPGLFPDPQRDFLYNMPVALAFIPSGGSNVTYTVTLWKWDGVGNWLKPGNNSTRSYTGPCLDYLENPGQNPWFIQINSISSGTLSIRFNQATATAL